jgi:hypothetical protein
MKKGAMSLAILLGLVAVQAVAVTPLVPKADRGPLATLVIRTARGHPQLLPNGRPVPMPSTGLEQSMLEAAGLTEAGAAPAAPHGYELPVIGTFGCPNVFTRHGFPNNVRVNQDCGFRQQAEEWVAVNPTNPKNIVASSNDSKYFGNRTGVEFSLDGGKHWGDSELPVGRTVIEAVAGGQWSFDAITDPAHTWDSRGNLYYSAIAFDAFQFPFDALVIWKANSCLAGSALHAPGDGACKPNFVPPLDAAPAVANHNFTDPFNNLFDDKNLMAADPFPQSPFRDNVYVTWTIFRVDDDGFYLESPIFFTRSEDGGVTWSAPLEISGNSASCFGGDTFDPTEDADTCNFDQGSYPVVGPDGTVYVAFNNCNTEAAAPLGGVGLCQQMVVKSTDAGSTWTDPLVVSDDVGLQPFSVPDNEIPDCPLFRQCLPPNGYRMNDFPSMGIDENTGRLAVFWADFRNGGPCTTDATFGVPVLPCDNFNNDVFVSISNDDGATWSSPKLVTSDTAAQWQPWGDVGENGKLYVGYYDRTYGQCESTGCNDISLGGSTNGNAWSLRRITTGSMPNVPCDVNPAQCGFAGDYMSIQAAHNNVYLVWADSRGRDLGHVPDFDNYFAKVRQ